jgi:hypothetical protein
MFDQSTGEPNLPTTFSLPTYHPDRLTHILLGDYAAVIGAINQMTCCATATESPGSPPCPPGFDVSAQPNGAAANTSAS